MTDLYLRYHYYSLINCTPAKVLDIISKHICSLSLRCPKDLKYSSGYDSDSYGALPKTLRIIVNASPKMGAYISGISHCGSYQFPTVVGPVKIDTNVYLTSVQLRALVEFVTEVEIFNPGRGNDSELKDNPAFECNVLGYDMSKIVSYLLSLGRVRVRYTDHEYRSDTRDLVWVQDFPMDPHSVEGIRPESRLGQHLISLIHQNCGRQLHSSFGRVVPP